MRHIFHSSSRQPTRTAQIVGDLIRHYNLNLTHSLMLGTEHIYTDCTLQHPIVRYSVPQKA